MMSIGALGGGQGRYYLELGREDYYLAGGEPPGQWWSRGARDLGLTGAVGREDLTALLSGFDRRGRPLVQNAGAKDRRAGWDATFSAPKSVSTLWALADPATRREVQEAHAAAVRAALGHFEETLAASRTGKAGLGAKSQAGLAVATFEHGTSRAQDPNLHTHCLVLNVAVRPDGSTATLDSRDLYQNKMVLGALYRAELSYQLEARLGVTLERQKGWFEVKGIPPSLLEEFSKRRREIREHLQAGGHGTSAAAAAVAALETRGVKGHLPRAELLAAWQEAALRHGVGPEQVRALEGRAPRRHTAREAEEAAAKALARLTATHSHFAERDLLRAAAEEAQARGLWADRVRREVQATLRHPDIVALGVAKGQERYTTREMLALEDKLLAAAERSRADPSHRLAPQTVREVAAARPTLSAEQAKALEHLTLKPGWIQAVTGMAGTGKSYLLDAAREAWQREGYAVVGAALAGKAAQGLQESARIPSATLHKTLGDLERGKSRLTDKTVVVVDEAGMVPTRLMEKLVGEVEKARAKLVLVGDARQLQPVEAGGPFRALCRRLGDEQLTQIQRQRDAWAREAVGDFARGAAADALARYAERGLVHVAADRDAARRALVDAYRADGLKDVRGKLVLAATNLDAQCLNDAIQQARRDAGLLGADRVRAGTATFQANDRVLFTRNSSLYGVKNGSLGTVREALTTPGGQEVLVVDLDGGRTVRVPLAHYGHVKLGYCVTTWKAQGETTERAFILAGGPLTHRELSYVDASRARDTTRFFVAKEDAGERLAELARQMSHSRAKDLAHDVLDQEAQRQKRQEKTSPPTPSL